MIFRKGTITLKDKNKYKQTEYRMLIVGLLALLMIVCIIALCAGQYSVSVFEVIKILVSRFVNVTKTWNDTAEGVVFTLRLPRVFGAALVGCALSLSGATYQGVFKNPLVAPDLLGVSSGACVGASVAILLHLGSFGVQALAFVAGIFAVGLTLFIPRLLRNSNMTMLVLSGIIVKGIMDSVMGIIKYIADPETELQSITYWQLGSLTKVLPKDLLAVGPVIIVGAVVIFLLRWRINVLSLGDREAKTLGVSVAAVRNILIVCATLLTASAVCISGTIGWVGLVIPHFARMITGPDNTKAIPVSILLGAVFMVVIDTMARALTSVELPLSILTGIIGAPFYIIILARQRMKLS